MAAVAVSLFAQVLLDLACRAISPSRIPFVESTGTLLCFLLGIYVAYRVARLVYGVCAQPGVGDETQYCGECGYNLTGNVSGRCPECGMDDIRHILWHFERRERALRLKVALMIVFGVPLSFLGPLALSTMFWLAMKYANRFTDAVPSVPWTMMFVILTAVTVPLLYRLERRTLGDYMAWASGDATPDGPRGFVFMPSPAAEIGAIAATAGNARLVSSLFVDFFLQGPRLVIGGLAQCKVAHRVQLAELSKGAEIIAKLLRRDTGLETKGLLCPEAGLDDLMPTLAYLTFYRWIGVAEDWQRVWIHSEERRVLGGASND